MFMSHSVVPKSRFLTSRLLKSCPFFRLSLFLESNPNFQGSFGLLPHFRMSFLSNDFGSPPAGTSPPTTIPPMPGLDFLNNVGASGFSILDFLKKDNEGLGSSHLTTSASLFQ